MRGSVTETNFSCKTLHFQLGFEGKLHACVIVHASRCIPEHKSCLELFIHCQVNEYVSIVTTVFLGNHIHTNFKSSPAKDAGKCMANLRVSFSVFLR